MNREVYSIVMSAVLLIIILAITSYVIPAIRQRIGEDKAAEIKRLAGLAVRYAEQVYTPEQRAEKKKAVHDYIVARAKDAGLTEADIEVLIEATVNEIKKG